MTLFWESLWPRLVPFFMALCVFLIVSWVGLWDAINTAFGETGRLALLAAFVLVALYSLRHLRSVKLPQTTEIIRRIESVSDLEHRPLTAQSDDQATGNDDALSNALWVEHQRRMAENLKNMTAGTPKPDANQFDAFAIRAALPVVAFAAFLYSFGSSGGNIVDAVVPSVDRATLLTRLDVWINPPAYTRKPPIYLSKRKTNGNGDAITAPQNSEFYLRYVGKANIEFAFVNVDGRQIIEPSETNKNSETEFKFPLKDSGQVELSANGEVLAQWPISVIVDAPPTIEFTEIPSAALSGSLQLNYEMTDDYGVVSARAEIKSLLETDQQAHPLVEAPDLPLPLPRQRAKSGKAKVNRDLTKHPLAGSKVSITLIAKDDAGQEGRSISHEMILPGRVFSKPIALALVEQRRILALDARKLPRVANLLDAISSVPEKYINNPTAKIAMRVAYRRLLNARNDDDLRDTLDLMWDTALAIEFGDLSEAERRLREAQEKLSEALENDASQEEIEKLMAELRQAMNEFMQQMMEQARNNPMQQNPFDQNQMQTLSQRDIDKMMDRIEDLAKSGSKDAARELLAEMQRMMDNLRTSQHQQQRQQEGNQMNQALDKLSELMQQQQQLLDQTFQMQRQNPNNRQNQQQQQNQQQGEGQKPMTPEEFAEALKKLQQQQEALQQKLGELGKQLEGMGLNPSKQFGEAQGEMGKAGKNLGKGSTGAATSNQAKALDALRRGAQQMMQQMAGDRQPGGQQPGQRGTGRSNTQKTSDPLGRNRPGEGQSTGDETKVPDEIDAQRARQILEAIRKRLSQPTQPLIEKDYLERLLESR
ncbi:MAG: TIGR02302 family protein [Hyphomicrobiales bacterium]|nr:MAG: TIGR02302 family protein [Hyphomicrobiales bacterium]